MQKKLIALAIAAAFSAPAMADVTAYGIVDVAVANISKTDTKSDLNVISGGLSTSRFGVKTAEDLDNGMKAVVVLEYALDVANNSSVGATPASLALGQFAARQQMLALAGGFGTVAGGYLQTTGYDFSVKFDPTAGSAVDSVKAVNLGSLISTSGRAPHALAYISPDMGGLTVAVNHSFNVANTAAPASGATTGNPTTANLVSVNYAAGPLAVGGVYAGTANSDTGYQKVTETALGASYDLSVVKLMGTYQTVKKDATGDAGNTNSLISFSAVAPVGPGAVVGSFAKNNKKTTAASDDTTAFTVAYLQNLSKTTTAYGALQKITAKAASATGGDVSTTVVAIGLKKAF